MTEKIEERLWIIAQEKADQFSFAPGCERLIRRFIRDGVKRMKLENAIDNEEKIRTAELNLSYFVFAMYIYAKKNSLPQLHEQSFHATEKFLCPLWPFC